MTKADLLPLAKTYFDSNPELANIFGTEDKHFFYREIQAKKYCKGEKKYFSFSIEDFQNKKPEKKKVETVASEEVIESNPLTSKNAKSKASATKKQEDK